MCSFSPDSQFWTGMWPGEGRGLGRYSLLAGPCPLPAPTLVTRIGYVALGTPPNPPPQDCTRATACEAIVGSEGSELGSSNVPWWVVWLDLWYCRAWRAWGLGSELRMGFWGKG